MALPRLPPPSEVEQEVKALVFSDVEVTSSSRTGFFGGRYAQFEITGSVTNKTDNPINVDNLPRVVLADGSADVAKPEVSQDKLLTGETCDISWKKELSVEDGEIPELSFSGTAEFAGLEETKVSLNKQMQGIVDEFAAVDEKKNQERAAREQAANEEAARVEALKADLAGCKGKTAAEAFRTASGTDYTPRFRDSYDVDVTTDVERASDSSEIGSALVQEVTIKDAGWFTNASVTFKLDYVDPDAKAERDNKAVADAARKQADEDLTTCKGKSADEALRLAAKSSYDAVFLDKFDVDVTALVRDSESDQDVHRATVSDVELREGGWFFGPTVTFKLDYVDPIAAQQRSEEEAEMRQQQKDDENRAWAKTLVGCSLIEVLDEADERGVNYEITIHPSGSNVTDTLTREDLKERGLVVKEASLRGYVSPYYKTDQKKGDLVITAVNPEYWEREQKLEGVLPNYNASRAVQKSAEDFGFTQYETWYCEAWDNTTWYIKGYCYRNKTRYTVEAKVAGNKSNPIVLEFNYY